LRKHNRKLDFVTYHTYGQTDDTTVALAVTTQVFHESMASTVKQVDFKGDVFTTEWGASYSGALVRDTEISASFIAKTIHLIGTDNGIAPPSGFAYWTISDLYEEFDSGGKLAFREGNYGLMLKGDPRYPDSYDVAKPAFNAYRLLHMMGETRVATSGGRTGDGSTPLPRWPLAERLCSCWSTTTSTAEGPTLSPPAWCTSNSTIFRLRPERCGCGTISSIIRIPTLMTPLPKWADRRSPRNPSGRIYAARASFVITRLRFLPKTGPGP